VKRKLTPELGRAHQRTALQIVSGHIVKCYRITTNSSSAFGLKRGKIRITERWKLTQQPKKAMRYKQRVDAVTQFLERDDNSTCTCLPGKRDKMTTQIDTA